MYTKPVPSYPSFIRYFVKRANNASFTEIDKEQYDKFVGKDSLYNWPAYIPFNLPWTTGGKARVDIIVTNQGIVALTERNLKLYGLSQYITNYTEFAI